METTAPSAEPLTDDWCTHHFDYLARPLAHELEPTLARMRAMCPIAHSDQHNGYWVVTRYEDVLRVAQNWETFSSELGVGIPQAEMSVRPIPEVADPPVHRYYKRLINAYFTPAAVVRYEAPTRALVTRLIDQFIEAGTCEFMEAFARPFPGLAFFDMVLNAPSDRLVELNDMATGVSMPTNPDIAACWMGLVTWITEFVEVRRAQPAQGDVVDAILNAEIEGRPVNGEEIVGLIVLLILGGLETTAGALGQFMIRFCQEPHIPALLRERPELVPDAVEELLRLDGPFLSVGRTARHDTELAGQHIRAGDKVLISWTSANRDDAEFSQPDAFDLSRSSNRHIAFGAGPHRCAGSNLARMNLRVAVHELVQRLHDIELRAAVDELPVHFGFNRAPLEVPIAFTPGARLGA
jgi:cytochrome P450